jgi:hypothetical protein
MFNIIQFFKNLFRKPAEKEIDWPGCLPPLTDFRNVLGSSLLQETPLPTEYRIPYSLKVKNQNGIPKCVGSSTSLIKEEKELRERNDIEFSDDWLYAECKKIDNYNGPGTYLNMPFKVLLHKGIKPLNGEEADAERYRIGGYLALDDLSPAGLKRAIYQWGAIVAGFTFSRQGWATEYIRAPKIGEATTGHAVALVGWDPTYLIGQNSFGNNWGRGGMFFVSKDYSPFSAYAIISDFPSNWKELLPDPTQKPQYVFNNNLSVGMSGEEITILQDALKFFGCLSKSQESTGYYGEITRQGLIIFQKRYGILATGFFGQLTRAKMNELLKAE